MKLLVAILVAASAAVGLLAARAWPRYRQRRDALRLHRRLCDASSLTEAESALLWELANESGMADPALVFVRPSLLDQTTAENRELAESARQKLFGA